MWFSLALYSFEFVVSQIFYNWDKNYIATFYALPKIFHEVLCVGC